MKMISLTATTDANGYCQWDDPDPIDTGVVASLAYPTSGSPTVTATQTGDKRVAFHLANNSGILANRQVTINFILH